VGMAGPLSDSLNLMLVRTSVGLKFLGFAEEEARVGSVGSSLVVEIFVTVS